MDKKKSQQKSQKRLNKKKPKQKSQKGLKWITYRIINVRKILASILIFLLVILLICFCYIELRKDFVVLIEPFEVPKDIEKRGYTGRVIANKLIDQINFIRTNASTGMKRFLFKSAWTQTQIEIEVTGVGVSINYAFQYIRKLLGSKTYLVVGEIISDNNQILLTTRVVGNPAKTVYGKLKNLDLVLRKAAEHIYKYTQPYILAAYLYDIDEKACCEAIQHVLSHEPHNDDAWAYNLWGVLLYDQGKDKDAIKKYKTAINLNPKFIYPYNNLGRALFYQEEYDSALENYQIAIDLDPEFVDPYCSWGWYLLTVENDTEGALKKYQMAIKQDKNDSFVYNGRGVYYMYMKKYDEAISDFERAIDLNPKNVVPYLNICELKTIKGAYKDVLYHINELLSLSLEIEDIVLAHYFQCIIEKLLDIDTTESEQKLNNIIENRNSPDFSVYQFKLSQTIEGLCKAINVEKYSPSLKEIENNIDVLNELLKVPGFYDNLCQQKGNINFSANVKQLVKKTKMYRNKDFSALSEEEQNNVKWLNRLSLKEAYPRETPKSRKVFKLFYEFDLLEKWLRNNDEIVKDKKDFIKKHTDRLIALKN